MITDYCKGVVAIIHSIIYRTLYIFTTALRKVMLLLGNQFNLLSGYSNGMNIIKLVFVSLFLLATKKLKAKLTATCSSCGRSHVKYQ